MSTKKNEEVAKAKKGEASVAKVESELGRRERLKLLKLLIALESKIHHGIISYYETGEALRQIQERELYKLKKFTSFHQYCQETFKFGRSYGYRLIAYSRVSNIIGGGEKIPERVIRALTKLVKKGSADEETIRACWEEAKSKAGDQSPNYKVVEDIVAERKRAELSKKKSIGKGQFYLASLKEVVSESTIAKDLIDKAQAYHRLSHAINEAKSRGVVFKKADADALKKKLREFRDADIEKLFE